MISTRENITFTGLICLAIMGLTFVTLANAQYVIVNDCTIETAVDRSNEAEVVLQWSNPHHQCVIISPGTTVTWNGNFNFHPLGGGVSPVTDNTSPISSADDQGGSVVLNEVGDYPYFCEVHTSTMTGVIYVRASLPFRTMVDSPAGFDKVSPANASTDQPTTTTLSWMASTGATAYEYCIDTTDNDACDTSWTSVGTNTSANPAGLSDDTDYFWQARASNAGGTTEANGGSWCRRHHRGQWWKLVAFPHKGRVTGGFRQSQSGGRLDRPADHDRPQLDGKYPGDRLRVLHRHD